MHLTDTRVAHEDNGWRIDFVGDNGEAVTVHVADGAYVDEEVAVECARAIMVQLTAFGTSGGGGSVNARSQQRQLRR
jgi:Uri superfamily endonuclease